MDSSALHRGLFHEIPGGGGFVVFGVTVRRGNLQLATIENDLHAFVSKVRQACPRGTHEIMLRVNLVQSGVFLRDRPNFRGRLHQKGREKVLEGKVMLARQVIVLDIRELPEGPPYQFLMCAADNTSDVWHADPTEEHQHR